MFSYQIFRFTEFFYFQPMGCPKFDMILYNENRLSSAIPYMNMHSMAHSQYNIILRPDPESGFTVLESSLHLVL